MRSEQIFHKCFDSYEQYSKLLNLFFMFTHPVYNANHKFQII